MAVFKKGMDGGFMKNILGKPKKIELPKIIECREDCPYEKYAGLKYSRGKRWYYVWYQAGPFTLKCEMGNTIEEAEKLLYEWLLTRTIPIKNDR